MAKEQTSQEGPSLGSMDFKNSSVKLTPSELKSQVNKFLSEGEILDRAKLYQLDNYFKSEEISGEDYGSIYKRNYDNFSSKQGKLFSYIGTGALAVGLALGGVAGYSLTPSTSGITQHQYEQSVEQVENQEDIIANLTAKIGSLENKLDNKNYEIKTVGLGVPNTEALVLVDKEGIFPYQIRSDLSTYICNEGVDSSDYVEYKVTQSPETYLNGYLEANCNLRGN